MANQEHPGILSQSRLPAVVFAIAIVVGMGGSILYSLSRFIESNQKVAHRIETQNRLDHLLAHIKEIENGQRSYVLTGNEGDLKPYFAALSPDGITLHLRELHQAVADDSLTQKEMASLEDVIAKKILVIKGVVDLQKQGGLNAVRALIVTDTGNSMMKESRRLIAMMRERVREIFQQNTKEASANLQETIICIIAGSAASLLLLLLSFVTINRAVGERRRSAEQLQQLSRELDQRVEQRTTQLQEELGEQHQRSVDALKKSVLLCKEIRLEKAKAFHRSMLEVVKQKTIDELLRLTIDEAEKLTESSIGFLHFVDENQTTLTQQCWSTNTKNVCKAEAKSGHYALNDAGIWANALRERRAIIHNNFTSVEHRKGVPEGHAELRREMVLPIFRAGKVVALIGVGNKLFDYTEDDSRLVAQLADAAWDVIEKKIADDEHKKLQRQSYLILNPRATYTKENHILIK